ncbi:MAG: hypothetical protein V7K14_03710 [Nostoc sp.]|uniref:hypothetical protein n=1 Tax=Nostoc sp. TaxID=1180 RepID=UPI002FF67E9D
MSTIEEEIRILAAERLRRVRGYRDPACLKYWGEAWAIAAKQKWRSPLFWLYITPRYFLRILILTAKDEQN